MTKPRRLTPKEAKEISPLGASKGGRARASVLTPEERSEIARKAGRARWEKEQEKGSGQASDSPDHSGGGTDSKSTKLPLALFQGALPFGDTEVVCYVLDNGKRVIAQREVVRTLTGHVKGDLGRYLQSQSLKPFINSKLVLDQTLQFSIPGTQYVGHGYEATLLLDICDAYLQARDAKALAPNQFHIAKQAEIITRACAKVGIIALIDEATGYQKFRKKRELQIKLQAFIAEDMQEWAKMFPDEFWFELARLEGVRYSPRNRPLRWGRYVMMFVYDAVDKDVGKELRKKNPNPHFLKNHHQWLKQFGRDKVNNQIQQVIAIMKLCDDMDDFRAKFKRVFKKTEISPQLSFEWAVE